MPAEQQQREDGYSSVGVPPSEAFEGLAKSYHGWVPRNAKAWIAPKHVHVDRCEFWALPPCPLVVVHSST
ncbi:hypothetical protein H9L39_01325 [Fusarium oxysporum f. sp. albedinis]|nr:hypothetical protein H9L39_01325 [Fusarium oxysporum f. sp. albedinis]